MNGQEMSSASHVRATREGLLRAIMNVGQTSGPIALMVLDVDRLRHINDALGWDAGDAVIASVMECARAHVGEAGAAIRIGGDEIAVVCRGFTSAAEAERIARELRLSVSRGPRRDDRDLPITVSMGLAVAPDNHVSAADLLEDALMALNTAKADGGGRLGLVDFERRRAGRERVLLHADLMEAVRAGEFLLHYQGQVSLPTEAIVGAEALIRWPHPVRGLVSPGSFIPLAEETGLIVPLGDWVMRSAAEQIARWSRVGRRLDVSVNVAAAQLAEPELVAKVAAILDETGIDPHLLTLEITESQVMRDLDISLPAMAALHRLGVKLSIDDFGTGYASMTQLKRVPADELKLDQSFIRDLPGSPSDRAIVKASIDMAHAMGMKVVAEGVEKLPQLDVLRTFDCDIIQGYLFTKPVPADSVPTDLPPAA